MQQSGDEVLIVPSCDDIFVTFYWLYVFDHCWHISDFYCIYGIPQIWTWRFCICFGGCFCIPQRSSSYSPYCYALWVAIVWNAFGYHLGTIRWFCFGASIIIADNGNSWQERVHLLIIFAPVASSSLTVLLTYNGCRNCTFPRIFPHWSPSRRDFLIIQHPRSRLATSRSTPT